MPGPAAAGQSGNGANHWPPLAERAKKHTLKLEELARDLGPDSKPSQDLLERLRNVSSFLGEVLMLVDDVQSHIRPDTAGAELVGSLQEFGGSIQTARKTIGAFAFAIDRELVIRAAEKERFQYRSHEAALKDRQTLLDQSSATVDCLRDLRRHLDGLLDWLATH
jgi:hypothetical protein